MPCSREQRAAASDPSAVTAKERTVKDLFEPPDVQCPRCGRQNFRWTDVSTDSRLALLGSRLLLRLARRLLDLRTWCRSCHRYFRVPYALPRTVVGYHGCDRPFVADLLTGRKRIHEWRMSGQDFEWLGEGIYFWEHAPGRAWQWAEEHYPGKEAVIAVEIRLGRCMDLADTDFGPLLLLAYNDIVRVFEAEGKDLPKNTGGKEKKARRLDCLVINHAMRLLEGEPGRTATSGSPFQTIRCPFEEGAEAYPGAMIRTQSHVQIAVRDRTCLLPGIYLVPRGEKR
jgi:hypothetical protein